MARQSTGTRDRIVAAAAGLFYGEGIRSVSLDAIAARAEVTKRTVYYYFDSKDDLIAAYLEARDQPTLALYARWLNEATGSIADRIEHMFARVAGSTDNPDWRGCGFLRTAAELANMPGHPAFKAGAAHKKKFEAWLTGVLENEGIAQADLAARQIVVLLDGAVSVMLIHRDPAYIVAAGKLAGTLVEAAREAA